MKPQSLLFAIAVFVAIVLLPFHNAIGQACCSGGVPLSGSVGLTGAEKNTFQLMTTYDYNNLQTLESEDGLLDDNTRVRRIHSLMVEGSYNFLDRLSATAMISWIWQERKITTLSGNTDETAINGLGDGIVLLKYHILPPGNDKQMQISVGAGPKIPLGRTDVTNNAGIKLPADLQPSTGSWDAMLWGRFSKGHVFMKGLTFTTLMTGKWTGTNHNFRGDRDYRFGNELQVISGLKRQFVVGPLMLTPALDLRYRHTGSDHVSGEDVPNTGGHWLYGVPSISVAPWPEFSFRIGGELPILHELDGTQLTTTYKIDASLYYKF